MWKRGEIAPKKQFLLFSTLFYIYIFLTSGVKLHIHLLNVVVRFIVFVTLSTLIYRGMDISKYFSESLGIRDNENRLYVKDNELGFISLSISIKSYQDDGRIILKGSVQLSAVQPLAECPVQQDSNPGTGEWEC